jgi:hypothetical protein
MTNNYLNPQEAAKLRKLSAIMIVLISSTLVLPISAVIILKSTKPDSTRDALLYAMAIYSCLVAFVSISMFFSKGASKLYGYLSVLVLVLYVFALLCLYLAGMHIYTLSTMNRFPDRTRATQLEMYVVASGMLILASISVILATIQLPDLLQFLRDFKSLRKSDKIKLGKLLFQPRYDDSNEEYQKMILTSNEEEGYNSRSSY